MRTTAPDTRSITEVVGGIPYRMAFAGGWIDQPFVSCLDPEPPGSMVVVGIEPTFRAMDRCGMATSTRKVAARLWGRQLPSRDPVSLVEELYAEENRGKVEPSGSQDMIGLVYPGVCRLDFDAAHRGGVFPAHIESCCDLAVARWLEQTVCMVPVAPRPEGYNPLVQRNLDRAWIRRLGRSGKDCYDAIVNQDAEGLGRSMNECMLCWEAILPATVRHPALTVDLMGILGYYQGISAGAMYSGCGGGYLYVVSREPVPGGIRVKVRVS